jgi:ribosome-associated protein
MTQRTRTSNPKAGRVARRPESSDDGPPLTTEGLDGALRALALALDKKALEPVLLDVRSLCSFCNYQLVLSGRSERQVDAIADGIAAGLKHEGLRAIGNEGARGGQWALLDFGDFVVHVFLHAAREHYDLEGLWSDAPHVPIEVPADAKLPVDDQYDAV